jgi:hypothetical protein
MVRLQDDILGIYNSLTDFSANTLLGPINLPIRVSYSESLNSLCFEQKGLKVAISVLNYYCKGLKNLKETYLYPEDYDKLMSALSGLIGSGVLLHDRVCLAPEVYGFSIYETTAQTALLKDGPQLLTTFRFVSGNSWFFKKVTQFKYKNLI